MIRAFFYLFPLIIYFLTLAYYGHVCLDDTISLAHQTDKLAHFGAYALLSALSLRALYRYNMNKYFPSVILFVIFWGVIDEVWQSFIPCRSGSFLDFTADVLGGFAGYYFYRFLYSKGFRL